jgi:hypothetical protein
MEAWKPASLKAMPPQSDLGEAADVEKIQTAAACN